MNVLITGSKGYIARALASKLSENGMAVKLISLRNTLISEIDFSLYDVVVHTAALVHKKESDYSIEDYNDVNHRLTIDLANAAKSTGVRHMIFLSSMAVFGKNSGEINFNTPLNPVTLYGKSKLKAEVDLSNLHDKDFSISIIRPPMVYGPNCPGNYRLLSFVANKLPIFPEISNKRSMIFIHHLTEFIFLLIENRSKGIFHPQDNEYVCTTKMVKFISKTNKKRIYISSFLGVLIMKFFKNNRLISKVFGDLYYSKEMSHFNEFNYSNYNLQRAIEITETYDKEQDGSVFKTSY